MQTTLLIACGALAHEITTLIRLNGWTHVDVQCLHASLHNTPEKIPDAVAAKINQHADDYQRILVAYGDCGTGGLLDKVIEKYGARRLPGPHCYSFFSGASIFDQLADESLGTFYLTDYLALNFERLILDDLGIRKHPELLPVYFGHYNRMLYLSQQPTDKSRAAAQAAAEALGLELVIRHTGLGALEDAFGGIGLKVETCRN